MAKSLEDLTVDELLARARETERDSQLIRAISANPEARASLQRAIKTVAPQTSIPEIDTQDAIAKAIAPEREERLKLERKIQEDDIRRRLEKNRADIKAEFKLSDDDVLEVEKLMTREVDPIPSYRAAAQVYTAMRQSATPTPASFSVPTFQMPENEVWGKGIGNKAMLDKIAIAQANEALNELRQGKAITH